MNNLPYVYNYATQSDNKDYVCNKCFKYHIKDLSKKKYE